MATPNPTTWTISSANKPNPILAGKFLRAVLDWMGKKEQNNPPPVKLSPEEK
jgi:hypothetical protein